ncbi:hypothetical protein [Micromonospora zhanjiangensis]|uniref:Uncharacterized protein n=1 Tax=Micromonospora zhanjiangensis TaxID=1522057 RepID=A0ABV8KVH1_9ACTN
MSPAATVVRFSGFVPQAATREVTVGRVEIFGVRAWLAFRRDRAELARRGGGPAICGLDQLDALMNLPAGLPVPVASVPAGDRRLLRRLPAGSLDWSGASVTRRVVPPLVPLLAMVRARTWSAGLRAASRFGAYCPRLMMVPALPVDAEHALAQASFYGVGVAVTDRGQPRIVLESEPLADWQPTPAWWWFAEEVYRQVQPAP